MRYTPAFMQEHRVVLLDDGPAGVSVGCVVAPPPDVRRMIEVCHLRPVSFVRLPDDDLVVRIQRAAADSPDPIASEDGERHDDPAITGAEDTAPAVNLVNSLLNEAVREGASDIHIECRRDGVAVRYRIDGRLVPAESVSGASNGGVSVLPAHRFAAVSARLKVLAALNAAERRRPQDGRFTARLASDVFDVRVSSMPTITGESLVLRLFPLGRERYALGELGMPPDMLSRLTRAVERSSGLVLLSGPTGSGKTTTLHAALSQIAAGDRKIITIEDPVEYRLSGAVQIQTNEAAGLTFESVLRRALRQDPNVIMVGEIRDRETALLTARAALTGHLVLATVHSRSATDAIDRLVDLGVERTLLDRLEPTLLAQRLIRTTCPTCRGSGCAACRRTGFRGRTALFEMVSPEGFRLTLAADGRRKVARGITTEGEVLWAIA